MRLRLLTYFQSCVMFSYIIQLRTPLRDNFYISKLESVLMFYVTFVQWRTLSCIAFSQLCWNRLTGSQDTAKHQYLVSKDRRLKGSFFFIFLSGDRVLVGAAWVGSPKQWADDLVKSQEHTGFKKHGTSCCQWRHLRETYVVSVDVYRLIWWWWTANLTSTLQLLQGKTNPLARLVLSSFGLLTAKRVPKICLVGKKELGCWSIWLLVTSVKNLQMETGTNNSSHWSTD